MGDNGKELQLPNANVGRLMKKIVPRTAKITKEAKETIQACVSEFISFVTSEAADKCHKENRRTLNGDDICWAFCALGLDNYAEASAKYLFKYREAERIKAQYKSNITQKQEEDDEPEDNDIYHGDICESSAPNLS